MNTSGVSLQSIDGWHDDGWCAPSVRGRLRVDRAATALKAVVWIKPENQAIPDVTVSFGAGSAPAETFRVPIDAATAIAVPISIPAGEEVDFRLFCTNTVRDAGGDQRRLSFVLSELAAD